MEIKKLGAEHYDELLEMLNYTFGNSYKRPMDFLSEQPKMWVRDDEHMGRHIGIFEDGKLCSVVGIYPLKTVIDGEEFLFATTGNVATLPEYEGRGYFNLIFNEIMKELDRIGADAARLGGLRQRYGRFGYEMGGTTYKFTFLDHNRIRGFGENAGEGIVFEEIKPDNIDALKVCALLSQKRQICVKRTLENAYPSMCSRYNKPYAAYLDGKMIGYLAASSSLANVEEINALTADDMVKMVCAWQKQKHVCVNFELPCHMTEEVRAFWSSSNGLKITPSTQFKVINWQKLLNALMRMKAKSEKMLDGEFVVEILGYGKLKLFVDGDRVGCELTDEKAHLTLDRLEATRLLLGPAAPIATADLAPIPRSWLPLPMSWNTLDSI